MLSLHHIHDIWYTQLQFCYYDTWHIECSQNPLNIIFQNYFNKKCISQKLFYIHKIPHYSFKAYFLKCKILYIYTHGIKTFMLVRGSYSQKKECMILCKELSQPQPQPLLPFPFYNLRARPLSSMIYKNYEDRKGKKNDTTHQVLSWYFLWLPVVRRFIPRDIIKRQTHK